MAPLAGQDGHMQDSSNRTLLQLFKRQNGTFVKLHEQTTNGFLGQAVSLEMLVNGSAITVKYGGQTIYTVETTDAIRGRVGIRSLNSAFNVYSVNVDSSL